MSDKIFVVAHNGYCEGHSLPYLAFDDRETALAWAKSQHEAFSVAEVPLYPAIPTAPWYNTESVSE